MFRPTLSMVYPPSLAFLMVHYEKEYIISINNDGQTHQLEGAGILPSARDENFTPSVVHTSGTLRFDVGNSVGTLGKSVGVGGHDCNDATRLVKET
jgi:hypothetical protein